MIYENDYVMRLIHQMVRALIKLIFKKEEEQETIEFEKLKTETPYEKLLVMADAGKINEAENELISGLDTKDLSQLRLALYFYQHLNEMTDDSLQQADYSRDEIRQGIEIVLHMFGYAGITDMFLEEME